MLADLDTKVSRKRSLEDVELEVPPEAAVVRGLFIDYCLSYSILCNK